MPNWWKIKKPFPIPDVNGVRIGDDIKVAGDIIDLKTIDQEVSKDLITRELIEQATEADLQVAKAKPKKQDTIVRKFSINPLSLNNKTLKQLNMMILDEDESFDPHYLPDSCEEATKLLTQNFRG